MISALALACLLAAQGDPSDVPAPLEPVEPAPVEPAPAAPVDPQAVEPDLPIVELAPTRVLEDPIARCKQMMLDADEGDRDARLAAAEQCFRKHGQQADANEDEQARAIAMADVVAAWRLVPVETLVAPAPAPEGVSTPAREQVSLMGVVESGRAEALVHGAVAGGGGGFLVAATLFSTTRANEQDSLPWLIASVPLGAVAGVAGAWALVDAGAPSTGDVAFSSSTMWTGATQGFLLQLAVFDGNLEVSSVPLRFVTVLGGGAVGLASGVALSPFLDVTQGDAAVANSAAFWGGVLTAYGMGFVAAGGTGLSVPQVSLGLAVGSTVPYVAALVAHPYLTIERWPSWLIEAGGAAGFLTAGGVMVVLSSSGAFNNGQAVIAMLGGGTLAGVVVGAGGAWALSNAMAPYGAVDVRPDTVSFAPVLFPSDPALPKSSAMPGVMIGGRF